MAFAATKRKRIQLRRKPIQQLKLTSMIDMFTILLVYLLKSYSPTDTPPVDKALRLPASISTKVPIESTIIQAAQNMIIVDGHPIVMVDAQNDYKLFLLKVDERGELVQTKNKEFIAEKEISEKSIVLPGLYDVLKSKREQYEKMAASVGQTFKGEITIMCDKELPYEVLKKVMATAGKAGFGDFKFAAFRKEMG